MAKEKISVTPNYIFEVSWEVCNKVGGINTVIATKAKVINEKMKDKYILIGPDLNPEGSIDGFHEVEELGYIRSILEEKNIGARVGRWEIEGNPIVVLVDFRSLFPNKDIILSELWTEYRVDSITGGWDYVEPVIFGIAAGRAIETITAKLIEKKEHIIAHFHEWMTASGGLYLKKYAPYVSTVFTTHATILGRSMAGSNMDLYANLERIKPEVLAKQLGIYAKYSMESVSAKHFDGFATVSNVTAKECKALLGAEPTTITPNGFEGDFVWQGDVFDKKRTAAREKLTKVAETILERKLSDNPFFIGTSGRYEFRNKGIDLFIKALTKLAYTNNGQRDIIAYITVPAGQSGVRKDLSQRLNGADVPWDNGMIRNITHYLTDYQNDPVVNHIKNTPLINNESRVQVIFVPCYIDPNDGLFECSYYELLSGLDMTVYASYYEPWGYTPMESVAFSVPTITTSLTGFGQWINENCSHHSSVTVIERNDTNEDYVVSAIAAKTTELFLLDETAMREVRENAEEVSKAVEWKELVKYYWELYSKTLTRGEVIYDITKYQKNDNSPTWVRLMVERDIPRPIKNIEKIARNLWWSWTLEGEDLFSNIDYPLWKKSDRNPISFLDNLSYAQLKQLGEDKVFVEKLNAFVDKFEHYMKQKPDPKAPRIAYFSMEYGLINFLKIFSGGLGVLAGDYLKEASDNNTPLVAVGLLYYYGYFTQKISASGVQEASYEAQIFKNLPLTPITDENGNWKIITINMLGKDVHARIWRCDVGRVKLYLLDTEFEKNAPEDRVITHYLYGGDWENRLKQELLLGLGGIKALKSLGIEADVYHCNEGHAAFIGLERIKNLIAEKDLTFDEALEVVRSSSLFTTHTPVPAGHDAFSQDLIRAYLHNYIEFLHIDWQRFLRLGMVNIYNANEKFSMSHLACAMSQEVNGVSWLHGEVSKKILGDQWPGYFTNELHIGYVTNGVHLPTWAAKSLRKFYDKTLGVELNNNEYNKCDWQQIYKADNEELWKLRLELKENLVKTVREKIANPNAYRYESPRQMIQVLESIKPDVLTIGFARRFATYKRAHLLFSNLDRLSKIVNNPDRPVQFIFAGKAHPNDKPGQDLIRHIIEISRLPQFVGKIIFLQNYDLNLAKKLVQGVDVWLNTPQRPLEASGTSGEKASMNGVMHFSVLDGWWVEGYKEGAGWALPLEATFEDNDQQNEVDAEIIYNTIEEQIAPLYYTRNERNIPEGWVGSVKKCIAEVASQFTTHRMLSDYEVRFYNPLFARSKEMCARNYEKARELAGWKNRVHDNWKNLQILRVTQYDMNKVGIKTGDKFTTEVTIDLGGLKVEDIGVELVVSRQITGNQVEIIETKPFLFEGQEGDIARFIQKLTLEMTGTFDVAIRVFAHNRLLAHRMDFALVKWA